MASPKLHDFLNPRPALRQKIVLILSRPIKPYEESQFPAWKEVATYLCKHYYCKAFTSDDISNIELYNQLPIEQSEAFLTDYCHLNNATVEKFVEACNHVGACEIPYRLRTAD